MHFYILRPIDMHRDGGRQPNRNHYLPSVAMSAVDSSMQFEPNTPLAQAYMINALQVAEHLEKCELQKKREEKSKEEEWKNKSAMLIDEEKRINQERHSLEEKKKELSEAETKFDHERKNLERSMAERDKRFEQQKRDFESTRDRADAMLANNESVVDIDVGGQHKFKTFCKTLCRFPDSTLAQLTKGVSGTRGTIFIDRDGKHFDFILKYLRSQDDEQVMHTITRYTPDEISDILEEAKYYNLRQLVKVLKWALVTRRNYSDMQPFEREGDNGYVTKDEVNLAEQNFTDRRFEHVQFKHITSFEGSVLERAVFLKCRFEAVVNFADTDLRKAKFVDCEVLQPILVAGANTKGAQLPDNVQDD